MEEKQYEIELDALIDNLPEVTDFVDEVLGKMGCSVKIQMQIDIAVEELFVNIAHYAYKGKNGKAKLCIKTIDDPSTISITFIDSGTPYNPLQKEDPDISLSADERKIGGLGIFMVKKSMNEMFYEYKNGQNQLTIVKRVV